MFLRTRSILASLVIGYAYSVIETRSTFWLLLDDEVELREELEFDKGRKAKVLIAGDVDVVTLLVDALLINVGPIRFKIFYKTIIFILTITIFPTRKPNFTNKMTSKK